MKKKRTYIFATLLGTAVLGLLVGCTADDEASVTAKRQHELRLTMGTQFYTDDATTRATSLPSGYTLYDHTTTLSPIMQIQGYLTTTESNTSYIATSFDYSNADDSHIWTSRVALQDNQYYLYGFMPKEAATNVRIAPNGTDFSKGATLEFTANAVSPHDICAITGVKGYKNATELETIDLAVGQFGYHTDNGDNLFLLADHIYAGLQFAMRVDGTYAKLRTIKVKSITLTPTATGAVSTYDVTVKVNISGLESVDFANPVTSTPTPTVIYDGEGKTLTTSAQAFLACLCPPTATADSKYELTTIYDVYDRKGNLIREDQTAKNTIKLSNKLEAGQRHTVNITVKPTYLYSLSDDDLNNPTFTTN